MVVGVCTLTLHIPQSQSLKDKRAVIRSILARLRSRFNVSAAEVGRRNAHQVAVLAVAAVGENGAPLDALLQEVVRFVASDHEAELAHVEIEWR